MKSGELEYACQAGIRFLSYRPRSRQEVRQRLTRRFRVEITEKAIVYLESRGYLNDEAFARFWRDSREAHRPRSAALIQRELEQHGVAKELANAVVIHINDEDNAYRAGRRRLRALQKVDYLTFRHRLSSYLKRRGFQLGMIRHVVECLWQEQRLT